MDILAYPNYNINPIFQEFSGTIWNLQIDCSLCSIQKFNSSCMKCLINIIKKMSEEKEEISNIVFNTKWEINETGTSIILELWKKRTGFGRFIPLKISSEDEENFIIEIVSYLREKFPRSELPYNYLKSKKITLNADTFSFLNYSLSCNLDLQNSYEELFSPYLEKKTLSNNKKVHFEDLMETYYLLDASIYKVNVYERNSLEHVYEITPIYDQEGFQHYRQIINTISSNIDESFHPDKDLEDLIFSLRKKATFELQKNFSGLKKAETDVLSLLVALKYINIVKIYGLFADENIEELFLDSPTDVFYLDHSKYGRCRTNLSLNENEIESFKSISKILSKKRLETSFPSLKYSLNLFNTQFRIAIDIGPVNLNDFSLAIRRARKYGWSLRELIQNQTIQWESAAFLLWCARNGINITVTGETDTGKTTLINAIDRILPLQLRRIYIEDVKESLSRNYDAHQLFFQASDSDEKKSKSHLIASLLHRSPDFVYLGEILTQEEAHAMFHCLSVGLTGLQTIHAQSIEKLLDRWIFHFKINQSQLQNLGIIVFMKKIKTRRIVAEIAEVTLRYEKPELKKIVVYDPHKNQLIIQGSIFNSNTIKAKLRFQNLSEADFFNELEELKELITQN